MFPMNPDAEKIILNDLKNTDSEQIREKLTNGYFGKYGSPKYMLVRSYLKERDRVELQEDLMSESVRLQAEANRIANLANKKAQKSYYVAVVSLIISAVSIILNFYTIR